MANRGRRKGGVKRPPRYNRSKKVPSTEKKKKSGKTKLEEWGDEQIDLRSMSNAELRAVLKDSLTGTSRRISSLKRNESFSYAMFRYEQDMAKTFVNGNAGLKKLLSVDPDKDRSRSYRELLQKAVKITHNFWASATSTKAGARKEQVEQSKRIFGVDKRGNPNRIISFEESKDFWALYDEYYNRFPDKQRRDSDRVQRMLGEFFSDPMRRYTRKRYANEEIPFVDMLNEVRTKLKALEWADEERDLEIAKQQPQFRLKVGADDDDIDI